MLLITYIFFPTISPRFGFGALYLYTKYYLLVIYHVLNFVMINKGCLVSQTMPGFLSFVDLGGASVESTDAVLNLKGRRHIGMQD